MKRTIMIGLFAFIAVVSLNTISAFAVDDSQGETQLALNQSTDEVSRENSAKGVAEFFLQLAVQSANRPDSDKLPETRVTAFDGPQRIWGCPSCTYYSVMASQGFSVIEANGEQNRCILHGIVTVGARPNAKVLGVDDGQIDLSTARVTCETVSARSQDVTERINQVLAYQNCLSSDDSADLFKRSDKICDKPSFLEQ